MFAEDVWNVHEGSRYLFVPDRTTGTEAREICQRKRAQLTVITSQGENDFVKQ